MQDTINNIGQITVALSFVLGTTLLALCLYFGKELISLEVALGFVLITILINSIVFIVLLGVALFNKQYRKKHLVICGVMLLNIPVAVLYGYMVFTSSLFQTLPIK